MTRTRKKQKRQLKVAARRLTEDKQLHEQLRVAVQRIGEVRDRVSGRPVEKSARDKKVYDKAREAATALTNVSRSLRKRQQPPKKRGKIAVAIAAVAGAAVLAKKRSGGSEPAYARPSA